MRHCFEIIAIHAKVGQMTIRWDGDDDKTITVHLPVDADGQPLPEEEMTAAILESCASLLERWDRTAGKSYAALEAMIGRSFDVTEAYVLRNI